MQWEPKAGNMSDVKETWALEKVAESLVLPHMQNQQCGQCYVSWWVQKVGKMAAVRAGAVSPVAQAALAGSRVKGFFSPQVHLWLCAKGNKLNSPALHKITRTKISRLDSSFNSLTAPISTQCLAGRTPPCSLSKERCWAPAQYQGAGSGYQFLTPWLQRKTQERHFVALPSEVGCPTGS